MDISFELYKIFYYAASSGSFSEAAHRLFISQSAISQAIKNLEEKMGGPLFIRLPRSIKLTPEGEVLFGHVEQAYHLIKSGENKVFEIHHLVSGEIRIGVSDTICRYFLIPYLSRFNQQFPQVKIRFINRTSPQILEILKSGRIDLGIVTLPVQDKTVKVNPFHDVQDIFVASLKYAQLRDTTTRLKELTRYPLLLLQANSATRRNLDSFLQSHKIVVTPEIELESIGLLAEFARIGFGIAHVLKESVQDFIDKGELFQVNVKEELPLRKLGIITSKNVSLSPTSLEFVKLLSQTDLFDR